MDLTLKPRTFHGCKVPFPGSQRLSFKVKNSALKAETFL